VRVGRAQGRPEVMAATERGLDGSPEAPPSLGSEASNFTKGARF